MNDDSLAIAYKCQILYLLKLSYQEAFRALDICLVELNLNYADRDVFSNMLSNMDDNLGYFADMLQNQILVKLQNTTRELIDYTILLFQNIISDIRTSGYQLDQYLIDLLSHFENCTEIISQNVLLLDEINEMVRSGENLSSQFWSNKMQSVFEDVRYIQNEKNNRLN